MVITENAKWKYEKLVNYNNLKKILVKATKNLNIKCNVKVSDGKLEFLPVENKRFIVSTVENMIPLSANNSKDAERIKSKGRNYLNTHKVTKRQYEGFFEMLNDTLDDLGLSADIKVITAPLNIVSVVRKDKEKVNDYPKLKSYPKEK